MTRVVVGGIYLVSDSLLTLPPESDREVHRERRRFVVLSGTQTNSDTDWPIVFGCPISGSTHYRTRFDVKLGSGEAGATKKCWIRVPAAQPVLKADLCDLTGILAAPRLEEVYARLLGYMGVLTEDEHD